MRTLKTKAIRILELMNIIDQINPKDLPSVKEIRLNVGLVKDLGTPIKDLVEMSTKLSVERNKLLKPFREEYEENSKDKTEEEKKILLDEINAKFKAKYGKDFEADQEKISKKYDTEVEVELSDEKYEKLKEWFEKFGKEKYLDKNVLVEMLDLLEL